MARINTGNAWNFNILLKNIPTSVLGETHFQTENNVDRTSRLSKDGR